jgi:two-component system, LytTR family, sensor kinase
MSGENHGAVKKWAIIFACWTFVGLFFATHSALYARYRGWGTELRFDFGAHLSCAYGWFLLTPLILYLARRFELAGPHRLRNAATHFVAAFGFSLVALFLVTVSTRYIIQEPSTVGFLDGYVRLIMAELPADLLRYWAVVLIAHAIRYHRGLRERELAASHLRAELAEARLEVLKGQLQPHFLFNTLNGISVLIHEDPERANLMLMRLSELLRSGLATNLPNEVTLGQELEFLDRYLEIERMRFGERLTIRMEVEEEALDARVPNLVLQPLVENSIKHGVAALDRPATITIRGSREGGQLRLEVLDDGRGLAEQVKLGVGLSNTEARLRHLYGDQQRLQMSVAPGGGASVGMAFPFRTKAAGLIPVA